MENNTRPFIVFSGSMTHKGKVRQHNEDGILCQEFTQIFNDSISYFGFYAVTDGVGGHECGEVASRMALETLANHMMDSPLRLFSRFPHNSLLSQAAIKQKLVDGVCKANKKVYAAAQANSNMMGTTLATALIIDRMAYIANIGDSRVYLMHGNSLNQITTDHSFVGELVAAGKITREDIYTHPNRNIITRYVGMEEDVSPDLFVQKLGHGDILLLCSDGLWEMVRDEDIKSVIKESLDPDTICTKLVNMANANGGMDNISAVVVMALSDYVRVWSGR